MQRVVATVRVDMSFDDDADDLFIRGALVALEALISSDSKSRVTHAAITGWSLPDAPADSILSAEARAHFPGAGVREHREHCAQPCCLPREALIRKSAEDRKSAAGAAAYWSPDAPLDLARYEQDEHGAPDSDCFGVD